MSNDLTKRLFSQLLRFSTLFFLSVLSALCSNETVRITLDSGEIFIGEQFVSESSDITVIKHELLGVLKFPTEAILEVDPMFDQEEPAVTAEEPKILDEKLNETQTVSQEAQKPAEVSETAEALDIIEVINRWQAPKSWSGNLKIGIIQSAGDRKYVQTYMRGLLRIQKEASPNSFQLKGEYIYQETERTDGDKYISSDRFYTDFTYRRLFSSHWFFQNLTTLRRDVIKGIEQELQNLSGVGYRKKLGEKVELLIGSGLGFQNKSLNSVLVEDQNDWVVNVFQELNWTPKDRMRLSQKMNYFRNPNTINIYNYDFTLSFNYRLTDLLGLEMRYTKDYDNGIDDKYGDNTRFQNALTIYF